MRDTPPTTVALNLDSFRDQSYHACVFARLAPRQRPPSLRLCRPPLLPRSVCAHRVPLCWAPALLPSSDGAGRSDGGRTYGEAGPSTTARSAELARADVRTVAGRRPTLPTWRERSPAAGVRDRRCLESEPASEGG